jgi:hypothetical protein
VDVARRRFAAQGTLCASANRVLELRRKDPLASLAVLCQVGRPSLGTTNSGALGAVMHVRRPLPLVMLLAIALPFIGVGHAGAQVIRGQVVDRNTQTPIPGAFIVLMDSTGAQNGAVLSGEDGSYVLRVPRAGSYRLRSERIGYANATSDRLEVGADSTLVYRFEISVKPIDLKGMKITGKGRCHMSRETGTETSVLWDQVRKALSIAVWSQKDRGVPYQTLVWSRARDLVSLEVLADTMEVRSGYGQNGPFGSEPAQSLEANGFIRKVDQGSYMFYGLDAKTLLSDDFLASHCFRIKEGGRSHKGFVGLAFEPLRRKDGPPDITGTLWVDQLTAELRYLEFRYDRMPVTDLPLALFGGRADFRRLDNGEWVVQRWWLRMPQSVRPLDAIAGGQLRPGAHATPGAVRARQRGVRIHEQGGEILFIGSAGVSGREGHSRLGGVVYDSTRSIPLAEASVFLTDINRTTTTDTFGHFQFSDLPAGTHRVAFTDPRADSLDLAVAPRTVTVDPNRDTSVILAIPRDAACPASSRTGGVIGFVEDVESGDPRPDVEVHITWSSTGVGTAIPSMTNEVEHTTTDAHGRYLFCGLPLDTELNLAATDGLSVQIKLGAPRLLSQELLTSRGGR